MKFKLFFLLICGCIYSAYSQVDSLRLGDRYWEDQLYLSISYDVMINQPNVTTETGFSYSFSGGYIKDIPFNRKGNIAAGIGVGYGYNSLSHNLQVINTNTVQLPNGISSNKLRLHNLEFPIQFRWRTSNAIKYSFWRVYTGVRLTYNLSNKFSYTANSLPVEFSNIAIYNKFQAGLELSAGYGAFNFYLYYGLSPIYKNVTINGTVVNSKIAKFGLIFYLL